MDRHRGFTLMELLVVVVILGILAGILVPVIMGARARAAETKCVNNLKQIGTILIIYRNDYIVRGKELNPLRLTKLHAAKYTGKKEIFLCPMDSSEGMEGGKPNVAGVEQFDELDEPGNPPRPGELPCSYMYEFCMAEECSWWLTYATLPAGVTDKNAFVDLDGDKTRTMWGEAKMAMMRYGDTYINPDGNSTNSYSTTRFPILRCFWHADHPNTNAAEILNLAYEGNVFKSGAKWETASVVY